MNNNMVKSLKHIILEKKIGETPLEVLEAWRKKHPSLVDTTMAYAGRLDPMASGKLLVLIGEECKHQENYHHLDKTYIFSVLFGVSSDSGDVLGLLTEGKAREIPQESIEKILPSLVGDIELPYPIFSSRTIKGKPLHTWTLEGRLNEITIPSKKSTIYELALTKQEQKTRATIVVEASNKIESIPLVTDPRKAIGNDFRRPDIRKSWLEFSKAGTENDVFTIATFTCTASSGTYMRSLSEKIAEIIGSIGLAFYIHRTEIGQYDYVNKIWSKRF